MPEWMAGNLWLFVQAALAIVMVEQLRRRVFPAVLRAPQPELVLDVWGPLALVMPMLFFVSRVETTVRGEGWVTAGGPVVVGLLGLAMGLAVYRHRAIPMSIGEEENRITLRMRDVVAWTGVGALLVLLAAAHDLTIWIGQCAFAVGAVLLWINTPDEPPAAMLRGGGHDDAAAAQVGFGMMLALLCAAGQGGASLMMSGSAVGISAGMMIMAAAMSLAAAAQLVGPVAAIRLGGWAAAYGVLLGLGLLAAVRLLPTVIQAIQIHRVGPIGRIASGFGAYALEGCLMLVFGAAALMLQRMSHDAARAALGWSVLALAALLAAWRLASM